MYGFRTAFKSKNTSTALAYGQIEGTQYALYGNLAQLVRAARC